MMFRRDRREMPLLNTTSTADISFMLLIFFLVTTSMDIDKGLSRLLPPTAPQEEAPTDVKEGLVMKLDIGADNTITCDDKAISVSELCQMVKSFIKAKGREHVIQLEADRNADYDTYFKVQNELVAAYQELRNEYSKSHFGKTYSRCTDEQQEEVRRAVPQRISEVYHVEKGGEQ